jgi:hypothetical protein
MIREFVDGPTAATASQQQQKEAMDRVIAQKVHEENAVKSALAAFLSEDDKGGEGGAVLFPL